MKRKIRSIGLFVLCFLFISATVFASPKNDLKQVWENQTFGDARYQISLDTKMALFGPIQNSSIIDVKREPLFIRSEDSMTMFGETKTTISYLVQDGDQIHAYLEEPTETKDGIQNQWVRSDYTMPNVGEEDIPDLLSFDKLVRSVKLLVEEEDGKQVFSVMMDGRSLYQEIKKYYENALVAELKDNSDTELKERENMRIFSEELLKTWENTENVTMMVMVKDDKIVGLQTELSPQFNSIVHIVATALDSRQGDSEYKTGALAEAFLATESMKLTIVEVGEAEHSAVPEEILKTAIIKESADATK